MEEYLQCMKTLRSQMNDVEEQAAKISVEEQMNITTIQTLEKDLDLVSGVYPTRKSKPVSKTSREKVAEDITAQLKEQQDSINTHQDCSLNSKHGLAGLGKNKVDEKPCETKDLVKSLMENLDAAKVKFDQLTQQKSRLVSEYSKVKESVDLVNCKINEFKRELREMDGKSLEEELQALLSDKAGETEFMQSLQLQISKLKEISDLVKCSCGEEFKVELDTCA